MSQLSSRHIDSVLFDAVGTLFETRGSVGELYHEIAVDFGSRADAPSIQKSFIEYWETVGQPTDKNSWNLLVRWVFDQVGPVEDFDRFFETLYEAFGTDSEWRCFPETKEVLEAIRMKGVRLGIVSNFDQRLTDVLRALEIDSFFSSITIPASCGYPKPDRRIFEHAIQLTNIPATNTLFVGDHLVQDLQAARHAGIHSVLIDRSATLSDRPETISSLLEIIPILDISTCSKI
jgi:putative hydrolase of the HAD superfamily